ncbi:MAG: MBL fold metallo-hydrolase, partial [Chloroflexi bacterium]|nr:MBL fold metallo-hydrolase [Chloroflexota bacterium]
MPSVAQTIAATHVPRGALAIYWLAQAGYAFVTSSGRVLLIDVYLSHCVERLHGFRRLSAAPVSAEELVRDVAVDCVISTHSHADHLDIDTLPVLAQRTTTRFVGAPDCVQLYAQLGIAPERYSVLRRGETLTFGDVALTGVAADHGDLAPDALGVLLTVDGIRLWHVGDTAFRPELWSDLLATGVDVILPPINGAFGNLNGEQAARLAALSRARVAIPGHFWMFAEHNGNPAEFL